MRGKFRNTWFVLALVLVTLFAVNLPLMAAEIIILHTNDVHSRLESHLPQGLQLEQGVSPTDFKSVASTIPPPRRIHEIL
jgi:2',3'-cyclic-nucleotide 2'-phosphodiesterase (5'-nucleotidase family)